MKWLIDFGNSNVKWGYSAQGKFVCGGSMPYLEIPFQQIVNVMDKDNGSNQAVSEVVIASVGKPGYVNDFIQYLKGSLQLKVTVIKSSSCALGVKNSYSEPSKLGIDRWLALIAAHHDYKQACIIVDVGTAITLDYISSDGEHQGGLIVPGNELMIDSLMQTSDNLVLAEQGRLLKSNTLLGRDTLAGIQLGTHHMIVAFINQVSQSLQDAYPGSEVQFLITGGGCKYLLTSLSDAWQFDPDLVLKGLYYLTQAAQTK